MRGLNHRPPELVTKFFLNPLLELAVKLSERQKRNIYGTVKRAIKERETCLASLLHNELNSNVFLRVLTPTEKKTWQYYLCKSRFARVW